MTPIEWYYARGNKQMGPVSSVDLKRMAAAGEIHAEDLVWREGMAEWTPARNVRGLFEEEAKPPVTARPIEAQSKAAAGPTLSDSAVKAAEPASPAAPAVAASAVPGAGPSSGRHLFDTLLDDFRPRFNARFVERVNKVFRACGSYGLFVAMFVVAAFTLIVAVKTDSLSSLLLGVVLIVVLAGLQYVAGKSCDAIEQLNRSTSGNLSSTMLPDCVAVLSKVVGAAALLGSVAAAIQTSAYVAILFGLAVFVVCAYLAIIAMNPAALNITIGPAAHAGDEALGVLAFLLKSLLRMVPAAFGAGVVYGVVMMGYACYQAMFPGAAAGMRAAGLLAAEITAGIARTSLIWSAALPFAAFLLFLLYYLSIDLCRAILILPGKIDRAAGKDEEKKL